MEWSILKYTWDKTKEAYKWQNFLHDPRKWTSKSYISMEKNEIQQNLLPEKKGLRDLKPYLYIVKTNNEDPDSAVCAG